MQKIFIGYFLCARQHAAVVLVCRWGSVGFGVNEDSLDGPDESWRVSRHCCVSGDCSKKGTTQKTCTKDSKAQCEDWELGTLGASKGVK